MTEESQVEDLEIDGAKDEERFALDFSGLGIMNNSMERHLNLRRGIGAANMRGSIGKQNSAEILRMLEDPRRNSKQLIETSRYLSASSSYYMRLMLYMARMTTLDFMVSPNSLDREVILEDEEKFKETYLEALKYIESFNIKHEFGKILLTMVVEDVFYGYERRRTQGGRSISTIQQFPADYCRLTGVSDGNFTFAFDMSYFGYDVEKLKSFPREFTTMYKNYLNTNEAWQPVDPRKGVCFKFREDLDYLFPPFAAIMPDILDHQETKDLLKSKNKLENFKFYQQKIPFKKDARSEKDYLINLKSVKMFHDNFKTILPDEIGLVSTPMEIEEYSFEKKNNNLGNAAKEGRDEIFDSAGLPSGLFINSGSKSAVALIKAIQTDEAIMFHVLRQFERFFNNRLAYRFKDYSFKTVFPDLTVYNREDKTDQFLKLAQYGVANKFLVASSIGLSGTDLVGMTTLENDIFGLDELLTPLQSSHTASGGPDKKESGGQEVSVSKLSDKGAEQRDSASNLNRI